MTDSDRRFIEDSFPVKEVGVASAKEKNIRHGHISTLHIWWARRPLAASRATAYAALTPAPKDAEDWQKKRDFIIQLCQWENSNNQGLLERARREILDANGGVPPKVLDPFAGGGSYPLEAFRLGCETYANDYNPVAVLIEKATLEYPKKFSKPFEGMPEWAKNKGAGEKNIDKSRIVKNNKETQASLFSQSTELQATNPLQNAVRYWSKWVLDQAQKDLAEFYPPDSEGRIPVGYIWARTIPCQNPSCGTEIPLFRSFWLAKKDKKKVALFPNVQNKHLVFEIVGDGYNKKPADFDPDNGTISRAVARCLVCGTIIDDKTTRRLFQEGKSGETLIAIVSIDNLRKKKTYRIANNSDFEIFLNAKRALSEKRQKYMFDWGIDPLPDEPTPEGKGSGAERAFSIKNYGLNNWGELFNSRQSLSLITVINYIREVYKLISSDTSNQEFSKAVVTYLALILSRHSSYNATLCWWEPLGERSFNVFGRQVLPIVFDYSEQNPFGTLTGNLLLQTEITIDIINNLSQTQTNNFDPQVTQNSATQLPYSDDFFDVVLTDPPYYDNVPYSYLSDYFYVWLKRAIGHIFPELFSTPLTPKASEIVTYSNREGGLEGGKLFFETNLKLAFQNIYRVLKNNGIAIIVYTHKSTAGWETVINALLDSGLITTSAWPINTEMQSRLRASESAALASSIYIVTRKLPRQSTGFYNDVRTELRQHLDTKLQRLWEEGIGGADFFIAAIGSAIEVFGKYEQVMDLEGNIVRADRMLEEVRTIATDYAVRQILHNGFATEISNLTRLYVLWRWNYSEALVPFDEARKLGQSCGIDISEAWSKTGVIRKEKQFVRMLGPQGRKLDDLDDPRDLIDVLHKALLLWEKGQRAEMIQTLAEKGHGKNEAFYRVAQAISETLPNASKEKKLLDGFLAGRERVQDEVEKAVTQGRLFE